MKQELILKEKLPDGWKWSTLGKECDVVTGGTPPRHIKEYYGGTTPWIKPSDLDKEVYVDSSEEYLTDKGRNESRLLPSGSVLVSCIGNLGKLAIAKCELATNQQINSLIPHNNINSKYLYYYLGFIQPLIVKKASTALVPIINKSLFSDIPLLVPPLPVQQQIVAKLDAQMAQIEIMKKEAEKEKGASEEMLDSYLKEIFESKEIIDSKKIKLQKITNKIGSGSTPRGGYRIYQNEGIPFIRSMNVLMNSFSEEGLSYISNDINNSMKNTKVEKGDVLLNITGASIGRVCVVPDKICHANVNQHVSIIRCKQDLNSYYLTYLISNKEFQKNILNIQSGATRQALTKFQIENFDIYLPDIKIQEKIVNKLKLIENELNIQMNLIDNKLSAISLLPSALLNEVFGKYEIPNK